MNSREKLEIEVAIYFQTHLAAHKFDSDLNRQIVVDRVASWGYIPCEVGVLRALNELVDEGAIERTDGGNAATDAEAARVAEQARLSRIASQPLTERDFDTFVRLTPAELERRYFSEETFRVRYDRACRDWGFRKPAPSRPASSGRVSI
jgi:hypothetical protein